VGWPTVLAVAELASIVRRLVHLEAVEAIRDLAARYCWGVDHRDLDAWVSVWAPDATWQVSRTQSFVGVDQIRGAVQRQWAAFPTMLHATANHRIEVDEDRAAGAADVTVMTQLGQGLGDASGSWVTGGGLYRDEYVRIDDRWYIARREASEDFLHGPAPTFDPSQHDG